MKKSNTATGKLLTDMVDATGKRSGIIAYFRINFSVGGMWMFLLNFFLSANSGVYANLVNSHETIVY